MGILKSTQFICMAFSIPCQGTTVDEIPYSIQLQQANNQKPHLLDLLKKK